jgi:hypothetical protein
LIVNKVRWRRIRFLWLTLLIVTMVSVGVLASYAWQPVSIPLEVKEPLEIMDYPSGLSLYPGETVNFDITIRNLASVTYFAELDFRLNDTEYQAKYVTFSNNNYSIPPGTQKLTAWLTISPTAPPANLSITIDRKTDTQPYFTPSPSPPPTPYSTTTPTNLKNFFELLGGGTKWAAHDGKSALYINFKDSWIAHHLTDGVDWGPWPSDSSGSYMDMLKYSATEAFTNFGLEVSFAGDISENLDNYDVVVLYAYWAIEPRHANLIRDYVANGGGVVFVEASPCYLTDYCKNMNPSCDLTSIQEWFGAKQYTNAGGSSRVVVNNPFGTSFLTNDTLFCSSGYSCAAITLVDNNAQVIALWDSGLILAFTREYGQGRIYYQG